MAKREEIIEKLSKKSDIRADWRHRVILDALQEFDSPCQIKELEEAINETYTTDDEPLFKYNPLYYIIQDLLKRRIILNNEVTNKIRINPDYITSEVQYLPVSNYSVVLFAISAIAFISSLIFSYMVTTTGTIVIVGLLYIIGQQFGSEFKWGKQ